MEGDFTLGKFVKRVFYFNPLPPCGGRRPKRLFTSFIISDFNPLPPCGGRRSSICRRSIFGDFNPLPPCGGRPLPQCAAVSPTISIHSLRVEGDSVCPIRNFGMCYFNPLPPCGGRRRVSDSRTTTLYFNPLPPCGGRRIMMIYAPVS